MVQSYDNLTKNRHTRHTFYSQSGIVVVLSSRVGVVCLRCIGSKKGYKQNKHIAEDNALDYVLVWIFKTHCCDLLRGCSETQHLPCARILLDEVLHCLAVGEAVDDDAALVALKVELLALKVV